MRKNRLLTLVLAALTLSAVLFGCAQQSAEQPQSSAIAVTDMAGTAVALDAPAERIVVINPADCEILYAIGAGDKVVGRGEYCNYPEEAASVQTVSSGTEIDAEQLIALSPDLVILGPLDNIEQTITALNQAGIKTIVSDANTIDETYTAIQLIGKVAGKDAEAAAVVESMKASFSEIAEEAKGASFAGKTVYFEVSPLQYGLWTAGTGTFMDEICTLLGMKNAFSDVSGWAEISEEQVIARDPDYIVTITMYYGEGQTPVEEILSRAGWQDLKAIKNNALLNADSDQLSRPGPRLTEAAETLYEFVSEH